MGLVIKKQNSQMSSMVAMSVPVEESFVLEYEYYFNINAFNINV